MFNCDISCEFSDKRSSAHLLHHIKNKIPTRITYADTKILPSRNDFLDDEIVSTFSNVIEQGAPVPFMPNAVHECNEYVNGVPEYRIYVFGILPCGSRAAVIIEDAPVFALVALPRGQSREDFKSLIGGILSRDGIASTARRYVNLYKMKGFQRKKSSWLRVEFANQQERTKFLRKMGDEYETANDDTGFGDFYFPVIARQYGFNTADWNRVSDYHVESEHPLPHMTRTLRVKLANYVKMPKDKRKMLLDDEFLGPCFARDNLVTAMWDIETHSTNASGAPPKAEDTDYTIFMLCSGYAFHHSSTPFFTVCAVSVDTPRREGIDVVISCKNESEALLAHTDVLNHMSPDILGAFNGGAFDWPLYREKMKRLGKLHLVRDALSSTHPRRNQSETDVYKWSFRKESIKIDAENNHDLACVCAFPGLIDTDILPIFLKLYTRAEVPKLASMNYFLAKNDLEAKEDMPYKRMFRIYERAERFKKITKCHCNKQCAECTNHVLQLDYKPAQEPDSAAAEVEYSDELYDEIDGRCCWCTKRARNQADIADVAYYCVIDCVRPQQLIAKRVIVAEKRDLSNLSYVSMYDAYYRADGMKVRNVIGKYAARRDIAFSNRKVNKSDDEKDHYPGAWVCIPDRLLDFINPIAGEDFNSLYPSIMMTYNLTTDMIVYDQETHDELVRDGYELHQIGPFDYERGKEKGTAGNKTLIGKGWSVRHRGIHKANDEKIVEKYVRKSVWTGGDEKIEYEDNFFDKSMAAEDARTSAAYTRAKLANLKHEYVFEPQYGRKKLDNERMGLFPYILKKLFDKRKPVKAQWLFWSAHIEEMEKLGEKSRVIGGVTYTLAELKFNRDSVDSKQKAIKVLANTFYGESGNFRSPIFEILVAAGVTTAGVYNITMIKRMVESRGCHVHYGDTDSVYISPTQRMFVDIVDKYELELAQIARKYAGVAINPMPEANTPEAAYKAERIEARLRLWEEKVKRTMVYMNTLKQFISLYLMQDNGTLFMNMAHEEVGLPTWFLGKKKYIMCAHTKTINFRPHSYFMRGIDIIKQGQSGISVEMGNNTININMSPDNESDVMTHMTETVKRFYNDTIDPVKFTQKAKYKPDKKNIPVLRFIERMRIVNQRYHGDERLGAVYALPDPGDKFTYVIAQKPAQYTVDGKIVKMGNGDRMEFWRAWKESQGTPQQINIDTDWYMKNRIIGILARFIASQPQFMPPLDQYDITTKLGYRAFDKKCVDNATAYLSAYCDSITGFNPKAVAEQGGKFRASFRAANKQIREYAARRGAVGEFYYNVLEEVHNVVPSTYRLAKHIIWMARNNPPHLDGGNIVKEMCETESPFAVWRNHVSPRTETIHTIMLRQLAANDRTLETRLESLCDTFAGNMEQTIDRTNALISSARDSGALDETTIDMINEWRDPVIVEEIHSIYTKLRTNEANRATINEMRRAAVIAKTAAANVPAPLSNNKSISTLVREERRAFSYTPDWSDQ